VNRIQATFGPVAGAHVQVVHVDIVTLQEALPLVVWPVVLVAGVVPSLAK
jgi:hypothetical protein